MKVMAVLGGAIVAVWLVVAILAPWLAAYPEGAHDLLAPLARGSAAHLLGTTEDGTDIASALVYGARVSALVGLGSVLISVVLGTLVGLVSGYRGGWLDLVVMRLAEIFLAFPGFLLAILIVFVLGGGSVLSLILALNTTAWAGYARLVRGQVMTVKHLDYVVAAKALGAGTRRIVFVHILPNVAGPLAVQATFGLAGAILAEASLSYLGLGPDNATSWGALLDEGAALFITSPQLALLSGGAIALAVLGVNLLGDALRDRLDPRSPVSS